MSGLEALAKKRRDYVDAARENGFEEGLRKLLADLYPDNAHFIYELLQNAEDAGAQEVSFELRPDGLRFEHNGKRSFDVGDIDSITGIGQSTKSNDATSIGKFGVGFKAVFAYTETPHVQSGEHSFTIHDLFVPTPAERVNRPEGSTSFWFPFNRPEKPSEQAFIEVGRALRELSRSTLLFLSNIRSIECTFPDSEVRLIERNSSTNGVIEIDSVHEHTGPTFWYRISGDVELGGARFPVAAAFSLVEAGEGPKSTGLPGARGSAQPVKYAVAPIDGEVFIYFPAVRETSRLKFHIHAPFASTVARDSVRDDDGNDLLIAGIAKLIAAALPAMRDAGLVAQGLLSALPNEADDLPERYEPIRQQLIQAFEEQPVTPIRGGGHAQSSSLIRSEGAIRAAMSPADVDFFRELSETEPIEPAAGWLPRSDDRAREFLSSLSAIEFGSAELANAFERLGETHEELERWGDEADQYLDSIEIEEFRRWMDWLSGKGNDWLRSFYAALGRLSKQNHNPFTRLDPRFRVYSDPYPESLSVVPLIRIQTLRGVEHVRGLGAFIPAASGLRAESLVLDSLVEFDESETSAPAADKDALSQFFKRAGVKPWDAAAQLTARFRSYSPAMSAVSPAHIDDLVTLDALLEEKTVAAQNFAHLSIFLADDGSSLRWVSAAELFIDEPFLPSGLGALYQSDAFSGTVLHPLSNVYSGCILDVAQLAIRLGATKGVVVRRTAIWRNSLFENRWRHQSRENENLRAQDWTIEHLPAIVEANDENLLRGLWGLVSRAAGSAGEAVYSANASSNVHRIDSQLVQILRETPWILDRDGNLRTPAETTASDLAEGMTLPSSAPLLDQMHFGQVAKLAALRERGDEVHAAAWGFGSVEVAQEIARVYNDDPDAFREWVRSRKAPGLPEASSPAPERRASRVRDRVVESPERRYATRLRSVRVQEPGLRSTAKAYLSELYSNDDGVLVCQICAEGMPFKVDDQYYFVAVQFDSDAHRDLQENRLALCPTCAAKYQHARSTPIETLREDLLTQTIGMSGSASVEVQLAGDNGRIRFVGKHAIDLQAALEGIELYSETDDADGGDESDEDREALQ
ncbi:sacsin N-terminal ATP-binding-like domain-containing protein [Rhodoglobus aureus]|uniref:Sacsin/Nov domain-containing protein n=1 Tax=Rhodoglobus aureus TaxID=191497 RepID=A0ABN1VNE2_9MICO